MKEYGIYLELDTLDLITIIYAKDYDEAREKAYKLGYRGEKYRVEEVGNW